MNRNNNPLNIKALGIPYKGLVGVDGVGHGIFASPDYGIRAALRSVELKVRNGKDTPRKLLRDWSPPSDTLGSLPGRPKNEPDKVAGVIAKYLGIGIDDPFPRNPRNYTGIANLLRVFSKVEMGERCPEGDILRGIALWVEDFGHDTGE